MKKTIKVLYVEDDFESFEIVKTLLTYSTRFNFEVDWESTYEDGLDRIIENKFDVYLLDFYLGDKKSIDLLKEIKSKHTINKPFIVLTGENNKNTDMEMLKHGASDYLLKDVIFKDIEHGSMLLERSIIYSMENKKLEKKFKESYEIKNLLLESTVSGICLVDADTQEIVDYNSSFLKMFNIKEEEAQDCKFDNFFNIHVYDKSPYIKDPKNSPYCSNIGNCPCRISIKEVKIQTKSGVEMDCLMQCRKTIFVNGVTRTVRIITFVDISKQKKAQNKLIEMQENMEKLIKKYGLEREDPEAILDMASFDLDKFVLAEGVFCD